MTKYRLTCKKCDIDHTHYTEQIASILEFWKNLNKEYGKNITCVHDYVLETFDQLVSTPSPLRVTIN